jgi:hypothetical protein
MNAKAALLKLGTMNSLRPKGRETELHSFFQYGELGLSLFSNRELVVNAMIEKTKSKIINPAKYITHFKSPLLKLEMIKKTDNKRGDNDESICRIPPIDNDTPGESNIDISDAFDKSLYDELLG